MNITNARAMQFQAELDQREKDMQEYDHRSEVYMNDGSGAYGSEKGQEY